MKTRKYFEWETRYTLTLKQNDIFAFGCGRRILCSVSGGTKTFLQFICRARIRTKRPLLGPPSTPRGTLVHCLRDVSPRPSLSCTELNTERWLASYAVHSLGILHFSARCPAQSRHSFTWFPSDVVKAWKNNFVRPVNTTTPHLVMHVSN